MPSEFDLPRPVRDHLVRSGFSLDAPFDRRIYTNRDLNLDKISVLGFDMDYTLAIYNQARLEELSIETTVAKLIARGYPEALLRISTDPRFAIRGLMVDKKLGNVVKMDRHGYVGRGYHGKTPLPAVERKAIYREQRLGMEYERFAAVDTLFALPEVTLFAEVVELIDDPSVRWAQLPKPTYGQAWWDVRECIDEAHGDGSIKERIKAAPHEYIDRDPDLATTLHKFRSAGKKLFLLTNSFFPYTDAVMRHLLDGQLPSYGDWTAFFDWVVVGSSKPRFFTHAEPFHELDREGRAIGNPRRDVLRNRIYQGGHQTGLQSSIGGFADEVLYVGDHIYGDIVRSKKSSGWRTALIVQELQHELQVRKDRAIMLEDVERLHALRARQAESITAQRYLSHTLGRLTAEELGPATGHSVSVAAGLLDDARGRVRQRLERLRAYEAETLETLERRRRDVDEAFNPYWGSSFAERHDTSRFGAQVESYACIYTGRVSNLRFVSPSKYFISPHNKLPHW